MENIVLISGEVGFTITLDPGAWLFDNRKVNMATYFDSPEESKIEIDYTENASKKWDKALTEGTVVPSSNDNKISKQEILNHSDYGICLGHFLKNSEPRENASEIIFEATNNEQYQVSLSDAFEGIVAFSSKGKPLKDGPLHFYFRDGRNKNTPFTNIYNILVR